MTDFVNGLRLNELFYKEIVAPLFQTYLPGLEHSANVLRR